MTDTNPKDEKRTRTFTVRTSVEGLRKPIASDANDESRVQDDTIFVCTTCYENFLSFRQTLQRNAKSQAVTGEPFRAGSAPITSAATTPQPAGRSIPKYARPWRAYFGGVGERSRSTMELATICYDATSGFAKLRRDGTSRLRK